MQLTLSEAAKLYSKNRSTIHRHLKSGLLSCTFRGDGKRVIDLSELIRTYGEPDQLPAVVQQDATEDREDVQQAMLQALRAMHAELVRLREEVAELKRLPAPTALPKEDPSLSSHEASHDDPHGLRALVRGVKETK